MGTVTRRRAARRASHTSLLGVVGVLTATLLLTGCRSGAVVVTFRPEAGSTYRYEVRVRSESEVRIGSGAPEVREEEVTLTAEHTVLRASDEGVRVQVVLSEPGAAPRSFVVIFDRAAQLEAVEANTGPPGEILDAVGLSEIFPAAAGAPPDRPLRPGARWVIDDTVALPETDAGTRLTGGGRLVELGIVDGEKVARLESSARLPASSRLSSPGGALLLEGDQVTDYEATLDLDDGSVRRASSRTVGTFELAVAPPAGRGGPEVPGTLEVRVQSETRRLGEETLSRQPGPRR